MRFLGNKESILGMIENLLESQNLLRKGLVFFDAFCGSGSVADYFKSWFDLIINDNLSWCVIYAKGRIVAPLCSFSRLPFDPFEYLNNNENIIQGFMYNNYSPGGSNRMYFTAENAGRIDYFRDQIEQWKIEKLITDNEYTYLLACLIDSVSFVSNTAGVYGAFLKKWDPRSTKRIIFNKVDAKQSSCSLTKIYNEKIEDIIANIECDILYLDPPYTQNQYGTQYHLLETLILNDNPTISKITGSRSTAPLRSDWSKEYNAHILFDKVMAKTQAKYVVFSYNNDGFMSKEFIEASMKRYGKPETYLFKKISYKKYQNWKSQNEKEHFEYLFFVEMKPKDKIYYESPLNYIGSKAKIVEDIINYLPKEFTTFIDAFGGGFNVGINLEAPKVIYNDLNYFVKDLVASFKHYDTNQYLLYIRRMIKKFALIKGDTEAYQKARGYYNSLPIEVRDTRLLFTLILYGYQQQIRFNSKHEFNNPVGMRWFNDKVLEKMISFSRRIKEYNYEFRSMNYLELAKDLNPSCFVYMDPPYKLTTGSYNDGKRGFNGWNEELEKDMFKFADGLTDRGISFMISYVLEHRGIVNQHLANWISKRNYRVIDLGNIIGISGSRRKEVLIVNYDI